MGARELALSFLGALEAGDADAALALVRDDARFELLPTQADGTAAVEGRAFAEELLTALPDLRLRVRSATGTDDLAVIEVTMEGTQAGDLFGVDNQEKHLDVEQAWLFWAEGDQITGIRAYWCQNQLYRRLAVKRLDRIAITTR